ncbi:hypothetical protein NDN01_20170 [Sphingomonas sp. QA11]|uniref:hypothetical protein n=1 Tax=Sphingomonas sp. QA11 TaxID=2950605 RepID=UPI00234958B3|nr:hypothetical protein [Sphingomonas sp. QA11]WCM26297.1 hypothetical protein NDN01_20170 [Sphingomonas sp. QA11]
MSWTDGATWVGTIVSIIAGFFAWRQAQSAKSEAENAENSASLAEQMRDQIAHRKAQSDLGELNNTLMSSLQAMHKYGPGAKSVTRLGYNASKDASSVRDLTTEMGLKRAMLEKIFGNKIDGFQNNLVSLLQVFANSQTEDQYVAAGCSIHIELTELGGNFRDALDKDIFGHT